MDSFRPAPRDLTSSTLGEIHSDWGGKRLFPSGGREKVPCIRNVEKSDGDGRPRGSLLLTRFFLVWTRPMQSCALLTWVT